jgi:ubiquinone/menaquinone biosynthesis C-methylase UbiE
MRASKDEEILRLNKKKWDCWAEDNTLENCSVEFMKFRFRFDFIKYQKIVVDLIDFDKVKTSLDIGCGTGWAVSHAYGKAGGIGEFYGVDLSPKMIEKAIANNKNNTQMHFIAGDSAELPFESNFFDAIISTNSFHHFPNPAKVLTGIYRILKPGGRIYILDPTADGPIHKFVSFLGRLFEKEHVKMYSTRNYKKMYAKAGIEYLYRYKTGTFLEPVKVHIGEKR